VTQVPTSETLGASENQMRYFFTNGRDWIKRSKRYHSQSVKTRPGRTIWKKNECIVHVDYSESYTNKQQGEIQSAYFGHAIFSTFTACGYFRQADGNAI